MVYKKIVNKIPSLSALMLAGIFGGCPTSNTQSESEAKVEAPKVAPVVNDGAEKESDATKNSPVVYSKLCIEYFSKICNFLLEKAEISRYLDVEPVAPIPQEELQAKDGKKLKQALSLKCKELINPKNLLFLPSGLRKGFIETFSSEKFTNFRSGNDMTGTKHKYAYATAINRILAFCFSLYDQYQEYKNTINSGNIDDQKIEQIKSEVGKLLLRLDTAKGPLSEFSSTTRFFDSSESKMLSDDQLARFLTDKDSANNLKIAKDKVFISGIETSILKDEVSVWVTIKHKDEDRKVTEVDFEHLNLRGAAIHDSWKVKLASKNKLSQNTMPKVDPFPNTGLSKKINLTDLATGHLTEQDKQNGFGHSKKNMTGGQLFFTLFRGNSENDFFKLTKAKDLQGVEFKGNSDNFERVMQIANSQGPDADEKFAEFLYNHITNNIHSDSALGGELFCIPDVDLIKEQIMDKVAQPNADFKSIPSNGEGGAKHFVNESVLSRVVGNILEKLFGKTYQSPTELRALYVKALQLELKDSTALFQHYIGFNILKEIDSKLTELLGADGKASTIIDIINDVIDSQFSEDKSLIVYKKDGKYVLTTVGAKIRQWLKTFDQRLSEKHKGAYITYEDFLLKDKDKQTGLDIRQFNKAMTDACTELQNLLSVPVVELLNNGSQNINYARDFPAITSIIGSNTKKIESLRLEYRNAINNNAQAPNAPAVGTKAPAAATNAPGV